MSKLLLKSDLIKAGVSPAIYPVFDHLWPTGMPLDAANVKRAEATGINIYPLAQQILPAGAWTAYIQAEAGLINAHKTQFDTLTQERNASIAVSRLGINEVLDSAAAQLTGDIAALGQDVAVLTGWDSNPDVIRAPFNAALAAVEAGIAAHIAAHNQIQAGYGVAVKALDAALEDDKIAALAAVIDAIPEPEQGAEPQA